MSIRDEVVAQKQAELEARVGTLQEEVSVLVDEQAVLEKAITQKEQEAVEQAGVEEDLRCSLYQKNTLVCVKEQELERVQASNLALREEMTRASEAYECEISELREAAQVRI